MSAWPNVYDAFATADTNIPTTTETVVATISGVTTPSPGSRVRLDGNAEVLAGTGTTAFTPRWRRGVDATGALVGEGNPVTVAAGNVLSVSYEVTDTPGEVANQTYVFTIQQTAATGAGTVQQASGRATV